MATPTPIRVLLVASEAEAATVAERIAAEDELLTIETATDGREALARLADGDVEAVVSAYELPDGTGLELHDELVAAGHDVAFVLFAAEGSEAVASRAVAADVDGYVRRTGEPEDYDILASRVVDVVESERARTSYEAVFDGAAVGITVHDPDTGRVLAANEHFCALLGFDREELEGAAIGKFTEGDAGFTEDEARELIHRARDGEPQQFEWLDETADGDELWVEVTLTAAEIGGRDRVLASVVDITDRKRREQVVQGARDRLSDFVDFLAHELQTPLSLAEDHLDLARENAEVGRDGDVADEAAADRIAVDPTHLDRVADAIERIDTTVDDLVDLAHHRGEATDTGRVSLARAAQSAWDGVPTDDASLHVADDVGSVVADETRLRALLENLFRNAAAHADAPAVRVGTFGDDDGSPAGFYVADDGPGIPPDERGQVLEAGYTTASDGTGFGLAIVSEIAEAHGWTIDLATSTDGGARVEIGGVTFAGEES